MSEPLLECVPNFSEGRDMAVIARITEAIESVEGITLLHVDPGKATNRTVVTFVGPPDRVVEAAVHAGRAAALHIDMRRQRGEHPRFGAMDVCPLVPVRDIGMAETVEWANRLGRRLGEEVGLTVFLYEHAASAEHRRNLAAVRAGEYEGLEEKLRDPAWQPDFGPASFDPRSGATAVGARNFLIAFNINLNTTSTRRANAIAFDVREKGRPKRVAGAIVTGPDGEPEWSPGSLKAVKAIGWYIEEYGIAQISTNLTDISVTPMHLAFDEVVEKAAARGVRVTGSEIVGLVPLRAMLDAGRHYLTKQQRSHGIPDAEIIKIAIRSMGLDDLAPFEPDTKIIEYRLVDRSTRRLEDRRLGDLVDAIASESPAPGGGSAAALAGALGSALGTMVANLAAHKPGWDARWQEFSEWAIRGRACTVSLLRLVDDDSSAFDGVLAAHRLPSNSDEEQAARVEAIEEAYRRAIEVPLAVMETSVAAMEVIGAMATLGPESSVSDAGVGALMARGAVRGAGLNVRINVAQIGDEETRVDYLRRAEDMESQASLLEQQILDAVSQRIA